MRSGAKLKLKNTFSEAPNILCKFSSAPVRQGKDISGWRLHTLERHLMFCTKTVKYPFISQVNAFWIESYIEKYFERGAECNSSKFSSAPVRQGKDILGWYLHT
jgi:hypothetical protein